MAQTVVNYATIHQAAEDCNTTGKQLESAFEDLVQRLQPLTASWDGAASEMWDEQQRQWNQALSDLKAVLAKIAIALPQIADGYQSTDNKVGGFFGG